MSKPLVALTFLSLALPLSAAAEPEPAPAPAQSWAQVQKAGSDALDTGSFGVADRLLQEAVIKSAGFGEADPRYAKSLGELGRLYTVRGRFAEAEPLLEEELHARELAAARDGGDIVPAMGSLIRFYLEHGTAEKAGPLGERMLAFVEGKLTEHRQAIQGPVKLEAGKPLSGWAGAAAPAMRNPVIEWAITCDSIGNAYRSRGNFDLAERLYKAALDVKETVLGKQHLSLANSFDHLGTICMDRNEDAEAEALFRYALEHTERILPPENPEVFTRLDKLAKCLIKEKKYDEAEKLYLRAQGFWKEQPSRNGSEARALHALGSLYVLEARYTAAAPVLREALQRAEDYHGPDSVALLPYLQKYSEAMSHLGQATELFNLKARANTISGITPE